jgi:hypothetical protein
MLQTISGFATVFTVNLLVYWVKTQSGFSKISMILLGLAILINLMATVMPTWFTELWGFKTRKVIAYTVGFWFCFTIGAILGVSA